MRTHVTANFCFVGEFVFSRTLRNFAPLPVNATGFFTPALMREGFPPRKRRVLVYAGFMSF
jgi:hypothetical protein